MYNWDKHCGILNKKNNQKEKILYNFLDKQYNAQSLKIKSKNNLACSINITGFFLNRCCHKML